MMTVYALLIDACGLSHREAATIHGVRQDTIKSWSSGRRLVPDDVIDRLVTLARRIDTAATESLVQIAAVAAEHGVPDEIELGLASDDVEARSIGWPCVGAQRTYLAQVIARGMARGYRFRVVPRGSAMATAAAADAHDQALG